MALVMNRIDTDIFISPRFHQVVSLHVLKNLLKRVEAQVPLLLGVHGPSGEGKTFQCEHILKDMGVKRFLVSGGQLDNPVAGHPLRSAGKPARRHGADCRASDARESLRALLSLPPGTRGRRGWRPDCRRWQWPPAARCPQWIAPAP